jgi:hypothetical protein
MGHGQRRSRSPKLTTPRREFSDPGYDDWQDQKNIGGWRTPGLVRRTGPITMSEAAEEVNDSCLSLFSSSLIARQRRPITHQEA